MSVGKSPRILITRLSHIGDCVLTLPLLNAIRRKLPQAFIAWAVESPTQHLLSLRADIDQLILVPKGWARKPSCWPKLFRELRQPKFDTVIDPQGITKSAALGRISGAKLRIGIEGRWGRELSPYLNNCLIKTQSPHIVDRSLELLEAIGIKKPLVEFRLPACSQSQKTMRRFLSAKAIEDRYIVINPGASWESKRWPTNRFANVANQLFLQHGLKSVIAWAGSEEEAMADRIHELEPAGTVIAPRTNLRELAALCQSAKFFIGGDTGPLHIASAMGTPCIGMYGTTRPEESGAYGPQHIAVQKWYQAGSCRERRRAENDSMKDITVDDVNAAVDQMIAEIKNGRRQPSQFRKAG